MALRSSSEFRIDRRAAERPVRSLKLDREISEAICANINPGPLCSTILPRCSRERSVPWLDVGRGRLVVIMQNTHTKAFPNISAQGGTRNRNKHSGWVFGTA
jgi:hypothetical protein